MGLKEFYYKLEDKYFGMLDHLEEKGINLYKLVDPLEKNGIPTFPLFLLFNLAVIALIIFLLLPLFGVTGASQGTGIRFVDETANPISETSLKLKIDGKINNLETDKDGFIYLKNLEKVNKHTLNIIDEKYIFSENRESYEFLANEKLSIALTEGAFSTTKTILFKTKSGDLYTSQITAEFSCTGTDAFVKTIVVTDGKCELEEIPTNCGSLDVDIKETSDYTFDIPQTGTTGQVVFSGTTNYATLQVTLKDKETNVILPNLSVSIYDVATTDLVDTDQTNENGIFLSEGAVEVSKSYRVLVSDPEGIYSGISDLDYVNGLQFPVSIKTGLNKIELKIKKDVIGFVQVKVKDDAGIYLQGVTAKLSKGGSLIDTKTTDSTGLVKFGVRENANFTLVLDKEGYLLYNKPINVSTSVQEITLKSIDQESNTLLNISVTDNAMVPLEYATVKIWNAITNTIVKTVTTDIAGKVTISNLNVEDTYFAEAIVGQFSGKTNNFVVIEREETAIPILVKIGYGSYNLTILQEDGSALSGAIVKTYDASTNKEMTDKQTTTTETGLAVLPVRADKEVFFVIEDGDSRIITKRYSVVAEGITSDIIIIPSGASSTNSINFVGYYSSSGEQLSSVSAGQSVTARFILNVNKNYSKVVTHIRTGEGETCDDKTHSVAEDSIFIKQIKFAGSKIVGSNDYTPCKGEVKDTTSIVRKDAKWFNVTLDNPIEGSYIIDADIVVTDTATASQSLFYRAEYHQGSSVLRNPIDNVIGSSTTSSTKQALYAYANKIVVYVGDSTGCENGVCYSFSIKDKSTNLEKRILDKFSAKDGTDYKFNFRLNFERAATDATMVVFATGQTIKLNNYNITSGGNLPVSDTDFTNIALGDISARGTVNGTIDLSVINDSSDELTIAIMSNSEEIFTKKIFFDIKPSKTMVVDVVPKTIVPFIPNSVMVGAIAEDGTVISDATVFIKINGITITDGKTNREGVFAFVTPAFDINDSLEIIVKKQGYKTNTTKILISENLVTAIPETIDVKLDVSENYSNEADVVLFNNSMLPLTIIGIQSTIKSDYISVSSSAQGITLDPSSQQSIKLSTKLTELGIDLMTQKVFKGNLLIGVNEPTLAKTWVVEIPIIIRITFGNAVDSTDCLEIIPVETTIRTENTNDIEYTVKIKNTCTVDDSPVDLGRIYVESDYKNTKKIGDFYAMVSGQPKKLELDEKVEVLKTIIAEKSADVKLVFKTKNTVKSGMSAPIIKFTSNRPNTNGIDTIESQHLPKIILNNYVNCIETPSSSIVIPYCLNYGYGMYGGINNFAYNPYLQGQNQYQYSGMAPQAFYQTGLYNSPNNWIDYMSSTNTYGDYRENPPAGYPTANTFGGGAGQFGCQEAQIQVKNNCFEELALQFSSLGGVTISKNPEMVLKKGSSGMLGVQGSQVLGQYKIAVNAKPNDDTVEEYTYVKDISVTVNRAVDILPENCITVEPKEFDFSGLDTKERKLMVINTCYDSGYALIGLNILNQDQLEVDGIQYFSIGDINTNLKPKKTYRYVGGKTTEIMTIKVRRNPEITAKSFKLDSNETGVAQRVTNIRKDYYDVGKEINKTALLGITYSNSRLGKDELEEEITLIDKLQWLAYVDSIAKTSDAIDGQKDDSTTPTTNPSGPSGPQGSTFTEYFSGSENLASGECYDPKGFRKQGLTGEENFKKYGFNRLLFSYNEIDVTYNICDYGKVYCDQDQLRIAMSKKADLYKQNRTVLLDGTYFVANGNKVAANPYLSAEGENPLDKTAIEAAVGTQSFSGKDPKAQLQALKAILNKVPQDLRKFTIIEITVVSKTTSEPTPVNLSADNVKAYLTIITDNDFAKNVRQDGDTYQFTVDSFLRSESKLEDKINSTATTVEEQAKIAEFLNQYLNTMNLFYGDTISPFIINAKSYGALDSGNTKSIFIATQFMSGSWELTLDSSSVVKEIGTPGTYTITLKNIADNKKISYSVQKVNSNILDHYNNNPDYKRNIFFTNPTNAYYFNYSGIPFKSTFTGQTKVTSIITNYNVGWTPVQDGIILNIPASHTGVSFKDIRPLQVLSASGYKIEYLANGKYSSKDSSEKKDTLFVFNSINDRTTGADYQLKTSSAQEMKFNITPTTLSATKNYTYVYGVLKSLSSSSIFTTEETSSVRNMVDGIANETMCFNFNNGLMLWYNPQKTSVYVPSTDTVSGKGSGPSSTATETPSTNPTNNTNTPPTKVNFTINSGSFVLDSDATDPATVQVTGGNLTMDLSAKTLSGNVTFSSGDKTLTVEINSGTATISGNTVKLNMNGKTKVSLFTVNVTTEGTLNTTSDSPLNGTYAVASGQQVTVDKTTLTLNSIKYT